MKSTYCGKSSFQLSLRHIHKPTEHGRLLAGIIHANCVSSLNREHFVQLMRQIIILFWLFVKLLTISRSDTERGRCYCWMRFIVGGEQCRDLDHTQLGAPACNVFTSKIDPKLILSSKLQKECIKVGGFSAFSLVEAVIIKFMHLILKTISK